jgi:hypothetical protein
MKKILNYSLILFLVFMGTTSFAQEKVLQLEHKERGVTRTIKENKRVRVKTNDGQKYKGRLVIVDANTISLDGTPISLNDIEKIKRDPLLLTAIATTGFIYLGSVVIGIGGIVLAFIDSTSAIPIFIGGGSLVTLGILNPSYLPAKKMAKGWSLSVQEIPTN